MKTIRIEPLEARIAPATFAVSPLTTDVFDADGAGAQDTAAEDFAFNAFGVGRAIFLATGDKLVFDLNHNSIADGGDPVLVSITKGTAIALLDDIDLDGHFEPSELAGLVVSTGFQAKITGDVSGTIITALNDNGTVAFATGRVSLLNSQIESLTVSGAVAGGIVAGGSISNLNIGKSIYGDSSGPSVDSILTGSAASGETFAFGSSSVTINPFTQFAGSVAGSIMNVTLARGAASIEAGEGGDSTTGIGGPGGSIIGLFISESREAPRVYGGDGGSSTVGSGGGGGSVSNVKLNATLLGDSIELRGGRGGDGGGAGLGATGGEIRDVKLSILGSHEGIEIHGGDGGGGGTTGHGGLGGSVVNVSLKTPGTIENGLRVSAGSGGSGGTGGGFGGRGGALVALDAAIGGVDGVIFGSTVAILLSAGQGGESTTTAGGDGGSITGLKFTVANTGGETGIFAGNGGQGGGGGGKGGDLTGKVTMGIANADIFINSGAGGIGLGGVGGDGGLVSKLQVQFGTILGSVALSSGSGGTGSTSGGKGGDFTASSVGVSGVVGNIEVSSGEGGSGGSLGSGGNAGDLTLVSIKALGSGLDSVNLHAGKGGDGGTTSGNGGHGGQLRDLVTALAQSATNVYLQAGDGGGTGSNGGTGGNGGAVGPAVSVVSKGRIPENITVQGGNGGTGNGVQDGGIGGMVSGVKIKALATESVDIGAGDGGNALGTGAGGDGGAATAITIEGAARTYIIVDGGDGGDAATGDGGAGGAVSESSVTTTRTGRGLTLQSGNGGDSSGDGTGGTGGEIRKITAKLGPATDYEPLIEFNAGRAGDSSLGRGGFGGPVLDLKVISNSTGVLTISSGRGGDSASAASAGGSGGLISTITSTATTFWRTRIEAGVGGEHTGSGAGGSGGIVQHLNVTQLGPVASGNQSGFQVASGAGGNSASGLGGNGGDLTNLTIKDKLGASSYEFRPGAGGDGLATGGDGGNANGITFAAPLAEIRIGTGTGSDGGAARAANGTGGDAGFIANITGKAGYLSIIAGAGGNAILGAPFHFGIGGAGGNVSNVNVAVTFFAQQITSGSGGAGGDSPGSIGGAIGGNGGMISNVKITGSGDIGNFARGVGTGLDQMGGLIAGLAGTGRTPGASGAIDGITAQRIAAIFAGDAHTAADAFTSANAVNALSHIQASIVGADLNRNGAFDLATDVGANGLVLGTTDRLFDGLLLARNSGFDGGTYIVSVSTLKLELV